MSSQLGKLRRSYTAKGKTRYEIEVHHYGLNKYQVIRGSDPRDVELRARAKAAQWNEMWVRHNEKERVRQLRVKQALVVEEKKELAVQRTEEARQELAQLESVLVDGLESSERTNWDGFKRKSVYPFGKPRKPTAPSPPALPAYPPEPFRAAFEPKLELLDKIVSSRRAKKEKEAADNYAAAYAAWKKATAEVDKSREALLLEHKKKLARIEADYQQRLAEWEAKGKLYFDREPEAILEYCEATLSDSKYPDYFPQTYDLDYNPETQVLVVDYQLPPLSSIPTLNEVRYVKSRDEFTEKHISESQLNRLYDNLLYMIALRTLHELFQADIVDALTTIAFNGYVHSIDAATGQEVDACVLSLLVSKDEVAKLNLRNVDPRACFKSLKGVGSSKLHSLAPVAPILKIDREDARFVDSYSVVDGIQEGDNLAAMDWEDFEHLIRELFEKEFSEPGSEVKVTRASRDGGIDAVVFDPDPLRGGKIVIQAKRYTNTVGVSAVRDLYGTVVNEGANKGILVTTADYGPDAYAFAKGKPLVLLSGGNLLSLLEKHGHKAWIDTKEAKKILSERKNSN